MKDFFRVSAIAAFALWWCHPAQAQGRWYKGNTHTVAGRRDDFLIVTGEEFHSLTGYGNNHTTVVNAASAMGDIANGAPYDSYLKQADYVRNNAITREEYYAWGQPYFTDARREGPPLVFGCADSAYFEFNPKANVHDAAACRNRSTTIRLPSRDGAPGEFSIRVGEDLGDYTVRIRSMDGKVVHAMPATSSRTHRIGNLHRFGAYIIEIRAGKRILRKKITLP